MSDFSTCGMAQGQCANPTLGFAMPNFFPGFLATPQCQSCPAMGAIGTTGFNPWFPGSMGMGWPMTTATANMDGMQQWPGMSYTAYRGPGDWGHGWDHGYHHGYSWNPWHPWYPWGPWHNWHMWH